MDSKRALIEQVENADAHFENINKITNIVIQRLDTQEDQKSGGGSSFGFGVGRNWLEAGLMTAGTSLLTGAISRGFSKSKKNKKLRDVAAKIDALACDGYYDKVIAKKISPQDVSSDTIMDIAKNVCWSLGVE